MARERSARSSRLIMAGGEASANGYGDSAAERDPPRPLNRLTERERQVLALVAEGKSNKEIARALTISVSTVKAHVSSVIHKLGVESRLEAAVAWTRWTER